MLRDKIALAGETPRAIPFEKCFRKIAIAGISLARITLVRDYARENRASGGLRGRGPTGVAYTE